MTAYKVTWKFKNLRLNYEIYMTEAVAKVRVKELTDMMEELKLFGENFIEFLPYVTEQEIK